MFLLTFLNLWLSSLLIFSILIIAHENRLHAHNKYEYEPPVEHFAKIPFHPPPASNKHCWMTQKQPPWVKQKLLCSNLTPKADVLHSRLFPRLQKQRKQVTTEQIIFSFCGCFKTERFTLTQSMASINKHWSRHTECMIKRGQTRRKTHLGQTVIELLNHCLVDMMSKANYRIISTYMCIWIHVTSAITCFNV